MKQKSVRQFRWILFRKALGVQEPQGLILETINSILGHLVVSDRHAEGRCGSYKGDSVSLPLTVVISDSSSLHTTRPTPSPWLASLLSSLPFPLSPALWLPLAIPLLLSSPSALSPAPRQAPTTATTTPSGPTAVVMSNTPMATAASTASNGPTATTLSPERDGTPAVRSMIPLERSHPSPQTLTAVCY